MTVAALYVAKGGCYYALEGVEPWGLPDRDARLYAGPWPVVAHPPCARWGRYWFGGPSVTVRKAKGDDGGCFAAALASVRVWGGVLEHPAASSAWAHFGLHEPGRGGWIVADAFGGWTCSVEQGAYGHRARKPTWLYAHGVELPSLYWGRSVARARLDDGYHSSEERATATRQRGERTANDCLERMSKTERLATPLPFRDLLLSMARTAHAQRGAA